jgi:hypothetical protein
MQAIPLVGAPGSPYGQKRCAVLRHRRIGRHSIARDAIRAGVGEPFLA